MAEKLGFVFVPGMASVGSIVFGPLVKALQSRGFAHLTPVDLPSVDAINTKVSLKPSGLYTDIAAVRSAIQAHLDAGRDVVVVAHSYGGTPSLYAIGDQWKSAAGKKGVVRAVMLTASMCLPGGSVHGDRMVYKEQNPEAINDVAPKIEEYDGEHFIIPIGFEKIWMPDITDATFLNSLRPSPLSTVMTPTPETGVDVKDWKISYLITKGDTAMPESFMQGLIDRAREKGAQIETTEMESGHFVQISHADEVADWIANGIKKATG